MTVLELYSRLKRAYLMTGFWGRRGEQGEGEWWRGMGSLSWGQTEKSFICLKG